MKDFWRWLQTDSIAAYFVGSLILCFIIFPYFFLGIKSPMMAPHSWALSDTVVSQMVFIPGLKSLKYQLFTNGQILWNNLRAMGMPLLSNEIQAAPMFPLTWLFLLLPLKYFWHFFVLSKLIIASTLGLYIARRILGFNFYSALFFVLNFCFGMYVLRYMNHPWHNAFVSGLFYWVFLDALKKKADSGFAFLGLVFSVYCLVTSGFPSNSLLMGLLVFIVVFVGMLFSRDWGARWGRLLLSIVVAHLVGLALSAHQSLALLDTLAQTASSFRKDVGMYQVKSPSVFLGMIFRFANGLAPFEIIHVFRLIPLFFFISFLFFVGQMKNLKKWDKVFFVLVVFAFLKYFPIWPLFNQFIGSLPVFDRTHFTIYGFTFFILPFAYFSARGFECWQKQSQVKSKILWTSISILTLIFVASVFYAQKWACEINPLRFVLILLPLILLFSYKISGRKFFTTAQGTFLFSLAFLLELLFTQPSGFISTKDDFYLKNMWGDSAISEKLSQLSDSEKINMRIQENNGVYADKGVATADVGATAILTARQQLFRSTMFEVPWEGYLPLEREKYSFSNALQATGLAFDHNTKLLIKNPRISRAYLARKCFQVKDPIEASAFFKNYSHKFEYGNLLIESAEHECAHSSLSEFKSVEILEDRGNYLKFAEVRGPTYLVLSDSFFPGWMAKDIQTNKELEILPANISLRALHLDENRDYQIELVYQPSWLKLARLTLIWGLIILASYYIILIRFKVKR